MSLKGWVCRKYWVVSVCSCSPQGEQTMPVITNAPNRQTPSASLRRVFARAVLASTAWTSVAGASEFPAVIRLSSLDGSNGFRLDGVHPYDHSGRAVAGAGDVN